MVGAIGTALGLGSREAALKGSACGATSTSTSSSTSFSTSASKSSPSLVFAPLARARRSRCRPGRLLVHARWYKPTAIKMGKQLGEGSFGLVYEGLLEVDGVEQQVVLKRAKAKVSGAEEMAEMERQINERVKTRARAACADYLGSCKVLEGDLVNTTKMVEGLWLVWRWEGTMTLSHCMRQVQFPQQLVAPLLGDNAFKGNTRVVKSNQATVELVVVQTVLRQILDALAILHGAGMVHRDVKPQNLVLVEAERRFKLIDLGACADLRTGANFSPDETILDPKYAAPEEYVLPQESAPDLANHAAPVALALGTTSWMQHNPDRFDMFAVGIIMLQLCMPCMRSDLQLQRFNRELRRFNYDLMRWKRSRRFNPRETQLLDAAGGAGWELAGQLLSEQPKKRPSAASARSHAWFRVQLDPSIGPSPQEEDNSLTDIASMAMKTALGRLRQLENAVLRVEATMTKQTQTVSALRTNSKADPKKLAQEERKLAAINQGLQKRIAVFEAVARDVNRLLGQSDKQIERAAIASETQIRKAEQRKRQMKKALDGLEDYEPGWGTRVRRAADQGAMLGGFAVKVFGQAAQKSSKMVNEVFENQPSEINRDPNAFLSLVGNMWKRKPSVNKLEKKKLAQPIRLDTASEANTASSISPNVEPMEKVQVMRSKMSDLENEVELMAAKMKEMEDRLKQQQEIIEAIERDADDINLTLSLKPPDKKLTVVNGAAVHSGGTMTQRR